MEENKTAVDRAIKCSDSLALKVCIMQILGGGGSFFKYLKSWEQIKNENQPIFSSRKNIKLGYVLNL